MKESVCFHLDEFLSRTRRKLVNGHVWEKQVCTRWNISIGYSASSVPIYCMMLSKTLAFLCGVAKEA